jgi:hypothetical protein
MQILYPLHNFSTPGRNFMKLWSGQGQGHQWCLNVMVCSITSKPLKGILWSLDQMFTPSRQYAEPMFQLGWLMVDVTSDVYRSVFPICSITSTQSCWLKVRVTSGGQRFQQNWASVKTRYGIDIHRSFSDTDFTIILIHGESSVENFSYKNWTNFYFAFPFKHQ